MKKVLVACEFSGIVREAFAKKGFYSISCDFLDTEIPGNHYKGDVKDVIYNDWDIIIAHPPCTRLCNSGVSWLHRRNLWHELDKDADFFRLFLNVSCKHVCIENPIPHKYALERIGVKYSQIIQPYQFGHPESKATCLWLKNLPELKPTKVVEVKEQRIWRLPPGVNRWKDRSRTYPGIAEAMAEQFGQFIL